MLKVKAQLSPPPIYISSTSPNVLVPAFGRPALEIVFKAGKYSIQLEKARAYPRLVRHGGNSSCLRPECVTLHDFRVSPAAFEYDPQLSNAGRRLSLLPPE